MLEIGFPVELIRVRSSIALFMILTTASKMAREVEYKVIQSAKSLMNSSADPALFCPALNAVLRAKSPGEINEKTLFATKADIEKQLAKIDDWLSKQVRIKADAKKIAAQQKDEHAEQAKQQREQRTHATRTNAHAEMAPSYLDEDTSGAPASGVDPGSSSGFNHGDSNHAPFAAAPVIETHGFMEDDSYLDPYPSHNPTSGLPMAGGGSPYDVGGNVLMTPTWSPFD
jgi:hypothetical protein